MPAGRLVSALVFLALLTACGGNEDQNADQATIQSMAADSAADSAAAPVVEPTNAPELKQEGFQRTLTEAGFSVFWPSGCASLKEQISDGPTRLATQEFIYTCDRNGTLSAGVSIRALRGARGSDGGAPQVQQVTEVVKKQLQNSGTRILRQRPLAAGGSEGVDVHAVEQDGSAEIWIRGILNGDDIFLLMAWDDRGGLFQDVEVVDFFASFRVTDH